MHQAAKVVGEVGMSRDERSMLLGNGEAGGDQLGAVIVSVRGAAQAVLDGRAKRFWCDECMNQLILGVELALAQGWTEVVDAFTDAGRLLQSYENGGKPGQAAHYLAEACDIIAGLTDDATTGRVGSPLAAQWRARYQKEVAQLERAGFELVNDDFDSGATEAADPFAFPDLSNKIVKLRPQDDLPSLDELPPLDSMIGSAPAKAAQAPIAQPQIQKPRIDATPPSARVDAARVARVEEARANAAAEAAAKAEKPAAPVVAQPSRAVVEIVDRICDELGDLMQRSEDERILSMDMIQGGVSALKREALSHGHAASAELCDEMLRACMFMSQGAPVDEAFTDLAFAFCGIFVEAMGNAASENVTQWRAECNSLLEEWLEIATRPEAPEAAAPAPVAAAPAAEIAQEEILEESPKDDGIWIGSGAESSTEVEDVAVEEEVVAEAPAPIPAPEPVRVVAPETVRAAAPQPVTPAPVIAAAPAPRAPVSLPSGDLFARAQEALARGDAEAAKALALQAAAMIAEAEVDKAEQMLRGAEARLKANVVAIEEARSDVKNTEKSVMNAASEVAAGETILGQVKSQTAKVTHDLQEAEAEVADIERQIAELHARLTAQQAEVSSVVAKLEEAKSTEAQSEAQLSSLRDRERDMRKDLEAARQRVKDRQRTSAEIEGDMDRAREMLSRQRTSLSDIRQTINRPEPIKTAGQPQQDPLLF